jgi:hypothetical protein
VERTASWLPPLHHASELTGAEAGAESLALTLGSKNERIPQHGVIRDDTWEVSQWKALLNQSPILRVRKGTSVFQAVTSQIGTTRQMSFACSLCATSPARTAHIAQNTNQFVALQHATTQGFCNRSSVWVWCLPCILNTFLTHTSLFSGGIHLMCSTTGQTPAPTKSSTQRLLWYSECVAIVQLASMSRPQS